MALYSYLRTSPTATLDTLFELLRERCGTSSSKKLSTKLRECAQLLQKPGQPFTQYLAEADGLRDQVLHAILATLTQPQRD